MKRDKKQRKEEKTKREEKRGKIGQGKVWKKRKEETDIMIKLDVRKRRKGKKMVMRKNKSNENNNWDRGEK